MRPLIDFLLILNTKAKSRALTHLKYDVVVLFIIFSTPSYASQPISLKRNKKMANIITYFLNICNIYYVKSLSKSVKWSMRPFPIESPEKGKRKHISRS